MYLYKVTFLGGSAIVVRANTPKNAWESATKSFSTLEIINIKYLRGK